MSTLFLIGNGFDVNCGMKTKYTDVYDGYIKEASSTDVIKTFKENISADYKTWGDFEMSMAEYAKNLNSESEFLECIRDFAGYMEQHLLAENERVKQLLSDESVLTAVVKEMEESLKSFYTSISHNIDKIMEQRNATYFTGFRVISFNYTDVFDVLWKEMLKHNKNNASVTHIHGVLQDGPVFGVDNISQINTSYELTRKGKRGFIKPVFNSEYDEHRVIEAKRRIKNSLTICAFGMSFGDSDLSWRNEIIEWLKEDKEHHFFVYRYNISNVKYYTVAEKLDIEDDAKIQLLLEWGIKDEELFNQIHIPCGKNIFNVETVLKEELPKRDAKIEADIKKKIEQGKKFVQEHAQDVVLT
ncbi:MAG: AbiH family protein [Eubacteriales bacterium]|nr:AbiH family protein [Eubacteriales bacterium]